MKSYYHIAGIENKQSIMENGLIAGEDGYIYLLHGEKAMIDEMISKYVALFQLGMENFSLFKVSEKGFNTSVEIDNVGELFARHQFRIKQNIEKKYIRFLSNRTATYEECCKIQMAMFYLKNQKVKQ